MAGIGLREKDFPDTMVSAGPICKKAEDLAPFLKVLIGANVSMVKLDDPVNLKNLKVFYQESSGDLRVSKVNKCLRTTLRKAVEHFRDLTGSAQKVMFYVLFLYILYKLVKKMDFIVKFIFIRKRI